MGFDTFPIPPRPGVTLAMVQITLKDSFWGRKVERSERCPTTAVETELLPPWVGELNLLRFCDLPVSMMTLASCWLLGDVLYNLLSGWHLENACTGCMQRFNLPCDALQGVLHTLVTQNLMKPVRFLLLLLLSQNTGIFPLFHLICKVKQTKTVVMGGRRMKRREWIEVKWQRFGMVSHESITKGKAKREHSNCSSVPFTFYIFKIKGLWMGKRRKKMS